jgi:hypothetical protein
VPQMAEEPPKRLTRQQALAKAEECRAMARIAIDNSQRIMLNSIAQTWERIAETAHDEH